jgi:hypothetical protein
MAILLEVGMRMLPVQESMEWLSVNEESPVPRFEPNRSFTYSKNWNFCLVNRIKSNNYGFISSIDYDPSSKIPLTAVIGDSFIEASIVDQTQTTVALLNAAARNKRRFYAFASSGSQLSTYLAYAKYANKEFHPDHYIFLLVGNDFDESLSKYGIQPSFHYFVEDNTGGLTLKRFDYTIGILKRILRKSMLFMYVNMNLEIRPRLSLAWTRIKGAVTGSKPEYVGQTEARMDSGRMADSQKAVDAFLEMIEGACGVPRKNILIGIDGMRPQLYDASALRDADESYFSLMRKYVLNNARKLGHPIIDMEPVFEKDYAANKQFFEYPQCNEGHWNERAHALFAHHIIELSFLD